MPLLKAWQNIRYSLWFIPSLIVAASSALAVLAVEIDARTADDALSQWPRFFGAGAEGARGVLEVIASATITIAALTFSITVLVLSLAASQYTPRIIRTFMGNRPTQTVLGVFVGIFVYCLIVLRSVRSGDDEFIPSVALTIAILLAFIGVGYLVFFIHHIASSIQASAIVSSVAADTCAMIDDVFPHPIDARDESTPHVPRQEQYLWHPVGALTTGYVQTVDIDKLRAYAKKHKATLRIEKSAGEFVLPGLPLASVTFAPDQAMAEELNRHFLISHYRTVEQDVGVGIRQLVDIALRAMSPALNDTTTAMMCVDFLSSILARLASRRIPGQSCFADGASMLITRGATFADFLSDAFRQIREQAGNNVDIYLHLLQALDALACLTDNPSRKQDIAAEARLVADYARQQVHFPDQLARIEHMSMRVLGSCDLDLATRQASG